MCSYLREVYVNRELRLPEEDPELPLSNGQSVFKCIFPPAAMSHQRGGDVGVVIGQGTGHAFQILERDWLIGFKIRDNRT